MSKVGDAIRFLLSHANDAEKAQAIIAEFKTAIESADKTNPADVAAKLATPVIDLLTEVKAFTKDDIDTEIDEVIATIRTLIPAES